MLRIPDRVPGPFFVLSWSRAVSAATSQSRPLPQPFRGIPRRTSVHPSLTLPQLPRINASKSFTADNRRMAPASLLSHVRSQLVVDVDSMNPDVAVRHTTPTHTFCDMTSNQAIVYGEAVRPEQASVFNETVAKIRSGETQLDIETQVSDAVDLLVCRHLLSIRINCPRYICRRHIRPE